MLLRMPHAGDIVRVARTEFGVPIASLTPVIGGWDDNASVWDGVDESGRHWSVKASLRDITFGLSVAASLADAGAVGVVAPRRSRSDRPWAELDGAIVTLSPWVDGEDASDLGAEGVDWEAFGRTLRAIHDHPSPEGARPVRRGIRRSRLSVAELIDGLDRRLAAEESLSPEGESARRRWGALRDRLDALAVAERRLKRSRTPTDRVTLHGDPHLGNVILDGSGSPWLIDFDESTVAPREVDLMLVELGVLFSIPIDDGQRRAFRDGYGTDAPIDEERLVRFGAVRAVEDLVWTLHRALDEDPRAPVAYDEVLDGMLGPHGQLAAVERALARLPWSPHLDASPSRTSTPSSRTTTSPSRTTTSPSRTTTKDER